MHGLVPSLMPPACLQQSEVQLAAAVIAAAAPPQQQQQKQQQPQQQQQQLSPQPQRSLPHQFHPPLQQLALELHPPALLPLQQQEQQQQQQVQKQQQKLDQQQQQLLLLQQALLQQSPSLPPPVPAELLALSLEAEGRSASSYQTSLGIPARPEVEGVMPAGPDAHSALLSLSLSTQEEHTRLRQRWTALERDNKQLQHLLGLWQDAYRTLETQHKDVCGSMEVRIDELEKRRQRDKQLHLEEQNRLQRENEALRDGNAALRKRQLELAEHSAAMFRQNHNLQEVLTRTRDEILVRPFGSDVLGVRSEAALHNSQREALEGVVKGMEQSQHLMESELDQVRMDHEQLKHKNRLLEFEVERLTNGSATLPWKAAQNGGTGPSYISSSHNGIWDPAARVVQPMADLYPTSSGPAAAAGSWRPPPLTLPHPVKKDELLQIG